MRPLLHPLQRFTIAHHALIWLLLMIGMASLAPPLAAQPHTGPACSQTLTPDTPQPGPDPQLYIELLAESGNTQAEHDLPCALPAWSLLRSAPVPQLAIAAGGLHVPDPLLGRYQANAPPRA